MNSISFDFFACDLTYLGPYLGSLNLDLSLRSACHIAVSIFKKHSIYSDTEREKNTFFLALNILANIFV